MTKISEGINKESKEIMVEVLNRKKEQMQYIKNSIKETSEKMLNELNSLSTFWINSYIAKLIDYNRELSQLEAEINLLTLYSDPENTNTEGD